MTLPSQARVVIIGGGVVGCSVAYHLTKLGWHDVVLLERKQLTSGTTWHAAGLIGQLRASSNMTKLARYSAELYMRLEEETGVSTGMRQVGSVSAALTEERREELFRNAAMARALVFRLRNSRPKRSRTAMNTSTWKMSLAVSGYQRMGRRIRPMLRWRWPRAHASKGQPWPSAPK